MKVMIDTNVIISSALNPTGFVARSFYKALMSPFEAVVCDYIIDEVHRKFQEKFPKDIVNLEAFLYNALQTIEVIATPNEESIAEKSIRDIKDRPIIRAQQFQPPPVNKQFLYPSQNLLSLSLIPISGVNP